MTTLIALSFLFSSILFGQCTSQAVLEGTWARSDPMPLSRSDMAVVTVDSTTAYILGGCTGRQKFFDPFYGCESLASYDLTYSASSNSFERLPSAAPFPRARHAAFYMDNKIYVVGGRHLNDSVVSQTHVYDTTAQAWTSQPSGVALSDLTSFVLDGIAYVVGGYNQDYTASARLYRYSPNNGMFVDTDLPMTFARGDITSAVWRGRAYVFGGWSDINGFAQPFNDVHVFDGAAWQAFSPLVQARGDKAAAMFNNRLHVIGGELVGGSPHIGMEVYDGSSNAWLLSSNISAARFRFGAAVLEGRLYVFGGQEDVVGQRNTAGSYFPISAAVEQFSEIGITGSGSVSNADDSVPSWATALIVVFGLTTIMALTALAYKCNKTPSKTVHEFDNPLANRGSVGADEV
eukprot:TRINITY_DN17660_c0_g1_i1.p1 TRINITY_DN17660_c0_g1~~TRINITY_DN17660_c0_g1_i1.p1  ORF type:complete len:404 (+),score=66.43 TRINITY_DN17660_c0_g1_i1:91-1302(+)